MPIKVTCTQCGGILHAPDDSAGKRGRCPTCGTVLTIAGETVGHPPGQFGAPPAHPPRSAATASGPWGPLPGGSGDRPATGSMHSVPLGSPAGEKPTYDLAKDSAPRPIPVPHTSEPIPPSHGSRVPPDPRKHSVSADPFAKPGRKPDDQEAANRGWRKVRRGLGWVRVGVFFLLLSVLAFAAVPILTALNVNVPNQTPGVLQIDDYSQLDEARLFGTAGTLALGLLCVMVGRTGVSAAPAASFARGPALLSSAATVLAAGGFVAFAVITGLAMKDSKLVPQFTPEWAKPRPTPALPAPTLADKATAWADGVFLAPGRDDVTPPVQGLGFAAFVAFGLVAEVWFVATLGRMAAALHHGPAAGRVNRFVGLVGLLAALAVVLLLAARVYFKDWAAATVWSKWDQLEAKWQTVALMGGLAFGGFVLAVLYWRMIGGVRRAILESVDPAA